MTMIKLGKAKEADEQNAIAIDAFYLFILNLAT